MAWVLIGLREWVRPCIFHNVFIESGMVLKNWFSVVNVTQMCHPLMQIKHIQACFAFPQYTQGVTVGIRWDISIRPCHCHRSFLPSISMNYLTMQSVMLQLKGSSQWLGWPDYACIQGAIAWRSTATNRRALSLETRYQQTGILASVDTSIAR